MTYRLCMLLSLLLATLLPLSAGAQPPVGEEGLPASARLDLECLQEAYPGFFSGLERRADGIILLKMSDGRSIVYDDGREKNEVELMANADVEDSMRLPYPLEPARPVPGPTDDPGRIRSYEMLGVLYGTTRSEISGSCVRVRLAGKGVSVAKRLQEPLARVDAQIAEVLAQKPDLRRYFREVACFTWRTISGTKRLSPHSYAIAIDLTPRLGPYWQWSKAMPHPAQKTWPAEIVSAFEENGFIWGGKWRHYDLMHVEYRPEIILKARRCSAGTPVQRPLQEGK